ncbi:hypothetical protein ApAK_06455 [Thermoplasmatales archaeon AK]|nr:hypothetical protein [Thermoplasmatales archaeon AK]
MERVESGQEKYVPNILDRVVYVLGAVFLVAGLLSFFYLIPHTLNEYPIIRSIPTSYYLLVGFPLTYLYFLLLILVLVLLGFLSVYSMISGGLSLRSQRDRARKYSGLKYLAVYVLVELIISEIVSYTIPGISHEFPLNQPFGVQNFILPVSNLFGLVLEFVLVAVALVLYRSVSKSTSGTGIFGSQVPSGVSVLVSVVVSVVMVAISPSNFVLDFTSFLSYFVIGIIIIRFGFLKALAVTFASTSVDVLSYLLSPSPILESSLTIFLFIIAFFGLFSAAEIAFRAGRVQQRSAYAERQESVKAEDIRPIVENLFIRSTCPVCGNYTFYVQNDLSLKCTKCGHEIAPDARAPPNISIQILRTRRPL